MIEYRKGDIMYYIIGLVLFILGCVVTALYQRRHDTVSGEPEGFTLSKFLNALNITDGVAWAKTFSTFFNVRAITIYATIVGSIYGYGFVKGQQNKPINIALEYGKEVLIEINAKHDALHIDKNGDVHIQDKTGKILRVIKVKDVPTLQDALNPIGFELKPFIFAGGETTANFTGGVGVSFYRIYKFTVDALASYTGVYIGSSYKITDNAGVGVGVGKGWSGDTKGILYFRWYW